MKKHFYKLLFLLFASSNVLASPSDIIGYSDVERSLDSVEQKLNVDNIDEQVRNNLFTSGSSPVMFTGEARIKLTDSYWGDTNQTRAGFMELDRHRLTFWEGNESAVRIAMLARPTGNVILWTKLGFNTGFVGHYTNKYGTVPRYLTDQNKNIPSDIVDDNNDPAGYDRVQYLHDKDNQAIYIHEDMNAGIAVRYKNAAFWARMGHTVWTEASPFTIWKAQPRNFAWDYLPFEIEQPIERYYDYNTRLGMKEGRAAWNKKPFQGIQLESIKLPGDIYANLVYGKYENYDNFEPEYLDYATDRGFSFSEKGTFLANEELYKAKGLSDTYRWMHHVRLAKPIGTHKIGVNYLGMRYSEDYALLGLDDSTVNKITPELNSPGQVADKSRFYAEGNGGFNFYKDVDIISIDGKGDIGKHFSYHADVAFSQVDTQYYKLRYNDEKEKDEVKFEEERGKSGFNPAIFAELKFNNSIAPLKLNAVFIDKKFYSPFSFVVAHEAMMPYGSNLLGAGKFVAKGEASPYAPNMAGANLEVAPIVPDGHLKFNLGLHGQPEKGFNAIYFPYIMNGIALSTAISNSSTRWGNGNLDGSKLEGKYDKTGIGFNPYYQRLGLGNQQILDKGMGDKGGIFADYLSAYEGFIAFTDKESAQRANLILDGTSGYKNLLFSKFDGDIDKAYEVADHYVDSLISEGKTVTRINGKTGVNVSYMDNINTIEGVQSNKFTHNYSVDWTINVNRYLGFENKFYVNAYAAYYELSTNAAPTFNWDGDDSKVMLGGNIIRLEPAFQVTKQFYIVGFWGLENWFSNKSYMAVATKNGQEVVLPGVEYFDKIDADLEDLDVKQVNTDYTDMAFGLGFDWDFMKRIGFHFRASHHIHKDNAIKDESVIDMDGNVRKGVDVNGYEGNVISGELKMFF